MSWESGSGHADVTAALERARAASTGHGGAVHSVASASALGRPRSETVYASLRSSASSASSSGVAGTGGALSVSAAMALAKGALEGVTVRIVGEVSELSNKPGYKAVYFTVKDKSAALPCMMWNNRYNACGVQLSVGALVELTGRFTLYAAKGRMNFDVSSVSLAGEGNLRLQVANLARKLEAEGLMSAARKRPLPLYPEKIGLVTSPRGAAVHDVLRTLRRRFPLAHVLLAGVPVEGAQAPAGIIDGMRTVVSAGAEVVLVVRGGGSFEDLMPFNDEALARAVAACPVPVVTGIGHEPDTSIADMVADVRASTPTAAAETVSPSREQLDSLVGAYLRSFAVSMERSLEREHARVDRIAAHAAFRDPSSLVAQEAQALDYFADRLGRALPASLARDRAQAEGLSRRIRASLVRGVEQERQQVAVLDGRLRRSGERLTDPYARKLRLLMARLHDLSPLAVVARGYAIAHKEDGTLVTRASQVKTGDAMALTMAGGSVDCRVERVALEQSGCAGESRVTE